MRVPTVSCLLVFHNSSNTMYLHTPPPSFFCKYLDIWLYPSYILADSVPSWSVKPSMPKPFTFAGRMLGGIHPMINVVPLALRQIICSHLRTFADAMCVN